MCDQPDTAAAEPTLLVRLTDLVKNRLNPELLEFEADIIADTIKGELWNVRTDELGAKFGELIAVYPVNPPLGERQTIFEWPHPPSAWHAKLGEYLAQAIKDELEGVPAADADQVSAL